MKYCQNCGVQLDDNANFCIECGGLAVGSAESSAPDYSGVQLLSDKSVFSVIKECASSPLFLTAIICYTVNLVLSVIFIVYNSIGNTYLTTTDGAYLLSPAAAGISSFIGSVLGMAPAALMAIGMWITYASARKDGERINTTGLSIIKVITIILLVAVCVFVGILVPVVILAVVMFLTMGPGAFDSPDIWQQFEGNDSVMQGAFVAGYVVAFIIVLIIFIAICVLAILYAAKTVKTVNSIRQTAKTGKISGKVSSFVAVIAIILGAILALSSLTPFGDGIYLSGLSRLLSAASPLLFGILLFVYKSKINAISEQE